MTTVADAQRAVFNLEALAGLFSLGRLGMRETFESIGFGGEIVPGGIRFGRKTASFNDGIGAAFAVAWAAQALEADIADGESISVSAGDIWRDVAGLVGATVDFVQGFLEAEKLLGEVTAEVLSAGVTGPVSTFKAKRVRRDSLLDESGALRLVAVQVDGKPLELLELDRLLADMLDRLEWGDTAKGVRATPAEERGLRWLGDTPGACVVVFEAVWDKLKRERAAVLDKAKHNRPALPRVVLVDELFPAMTKQLQLLDDGKVRTDKGRILGAIVVDADTTLAVVRAGAALLGSEPGHEMIHELVHRAFDAHEAGASDPRRVGFIGGWGALAEAIGYGKGDHSILKLIAKAGQAIEWQTRHIGAGGLWTWTDKRGSRHGGAGEVAFVLGDALLPGLAAAMKREPLARTLSAREARRLVVEPRYKPPTSGVRPNERGAVWTLWRLFMLELTDKSVEYCGKGSIAVTVPRWRELHEQARLPWATHEKVLASWLEGESAKAPAFLAELEPGRFDLAPVHDLERVFLAEQGRRRLESATEGAKGPRAKASKKRK